VLRHSVSHGFAGQDSRNQRTELLGTLELTFHQCWNELHYLANEIDVHYSIVPTELSPGRAQGACRDSHCPCHRKYAAVQLQTSARTPKSKALWKGSSMRPSTYVRAVRIRGSREPAARFVEFNPICWAFPVCRSIPAVT
jgi:hypothetical protein